MIVFIDDNNPDQEPDNATIIIADIPDDFKIISVSTFNGIKHIVIPEYKERFDEIKVVAKIELDLPLLYKTYSMSPEWYTSILGSIGRMARCEALYIVYPESVNFGSLFYSRTATTNLASQTKSFQGLASISIMNT